MTIGISNRLDGLKHLSKIHRNQFDERRRTEWKIVLTVLAFYFGIITAKITDTFNIEQSNIILKIVIWAIFIIIAIVAIGYLAFIHKANYKNKYIAKEAENAIISVLNGSTSNLDIFSFPQIIEWKNWSWYMQSLLIITISFSSALLITI